MRRNALVVPTVLAAVALALAAYGAGCGALGSASLARNYYTLDYRPQSSVPVGSMRPYPVALQVGRFDVQRATNRTNIVYRYSPHQLQYYERERWAVRPDDMIRDMVFRHLEEARLTTRLDREFYDARPDFVLQGTVEALERLDAGDLFFGHLAMTFKLIRSETGEEVWSHSFDQRRRVPSREMVQTVQALSGILQAEMNQVAVQLDSLLLEVSLGRRLAPVPADSLSDAPRPPAGPEAGEGEVDESSFEVIRGR